METQESCLIKLITGETILTIVHDHEDDNTLIIAFPYLVTYKKKKNNTITIELREWMIGSSEQIFPLSFNDVVVMNSANDYMNQLYNQCLINHVVKTTPQNNLDTYLNNPFGRN